MVYSLIRPLVFLQNSETAHHRMMALGKVLNRFPFKQVVHGLFHFEHPSLYQRLGDLEFPNPVGLAAGFDKNAELVNFFPHVGFGFVEVGSVTTQPSLGNPKPRSFRLPKDRALINRLGLPNQGAQVIGPRLEKLKIEIPVGINIAKTHDPNILGDQAIYDFCESFQKLYPLGNYLTLNISCPNTAEGKTFEDPKAFRELITAIREKIPGKNFDKPVFIKLSPDIALNDLDQVLEIATELGTNHFVISNTSAGREGLNASNEQIEQMGRGGLSGFPIQKRSTELIRYVYQKLDHPVIIGLGGIFSAEDAYQKIKAGASFVQVYTGLIYEGPGLVKKINQGLVRLLQRDGFKNIREAVGKAL